jgi:hypothetical protein
MKASMAFLKSFIVFFPTSYECLPYLGRLYSRP